MEEGSSPSAERDELSLLAASNAFEHESASEELGISIFLVESSTQRLTSAFLERVGRNKIRLETPQARARPMIVPRASSPELIRRFKPGNKFSSFRLTTT